MHDLAAMAPTPGGPARAHVGISGWRYPAWRGEFYPKGLRQADELDYAAGRLTSIEVNGSFYSLQRPSNWTRWRDATPEGFVFAVKGARFITHLRRLGDIRAPLANFFASGLLALDGKLGPVLWQLPPTLSYDRELLERFLGMLPRTRGEAAALAAGHDDRVDGRTWFDLPPSDATPLRHAVEVRHPSFEEEADAWTGLLAEHGIASVTADTAGKFPRIDRTTADFAYARLHGEEELYASGYDPPAIERWATWVEGHLAEGRDAYVYFDNDIKVRAPFDAIALIARLGG